MSTRQEQTRAETVRRRRARQATNRANQPAIPVYQYVPQSARRAHGTGHASPSHKSRQNVRQRYDIALNVPGASVRVSAIPAIQPGWRLLSAAIIAGLIWALYTFWTSPQFVVTEIQIQGNQLLSPAEINSALGMAGKPIFLIIPRQVEYFLNNVFPELASADVSVGLPNHVMVTLAERQPIIMWQQNQGYTWIDAQGIAFRPRGLAEGLIKVVALGPPPSNAVTVGTGGQPPAPTTTTTTPSTFISTEMVATIQVLAHHAPADTPITYDPRYGLGWSDGRGWQVYFGQESEDIVLKLRVYQSMVERLTQQGIYPVLINVAYPNAPYYRLEQ